MAKRRQFTAEFKVQVVLEWLRGAKTTTELCREHQLKPQLLSNWKQTLLTYAPMVFAREEAQAADQERIAELERLVGRLTLEVDLLKKASNWLDSASRRNAP